MCAISAFPKVGVGGLWQRPLAMLNGNRGRPVLSAMTARRTYDRVGTGYSSELDRSWSRIVNTPDMIHRFAAAILASADRQGVSEKLLASNRFGQSRWKGEDLRRFLSGLSHIIQDEFFGLASPGCPVGVAKFGLELLMVGESLGAALKRCYEFYGLVAPGVRFQLTEHGASAQIEIQLADPSLDRDNFLIEYYSTRWHMLVQWLIGEEFSFDRIEFPHAPQVALSEYVRVFGDNCVFNGSRAVIVFPGRFLKRRIIRHPSDIELVESYKSYDPLDLGDSERRWRSLLKETVVSRLLDMQPIPTLDELAANFGVCSQTLRRRLNAEGSSYRSVKAEARREIVLEGIGDDTISLGQISMMAGFAEPNGLVRAIRNWTGLSPSQYRKSMFETSSDHIQYRCPHCAKGFTVN